MVNLKDSYFEFCDNVGTAIGISSSLARSIVTALLNNFLFNVFYLPFLAYCLLVNYMAELNFFSYDLVSDSFFAVNIFVITMLAGLVLAALGMFSSGIFWYANRETRKSVNDCKDNNHSSSWKNYAPFLTLNILFITLMAILTFLSSDRIFPIFVTLICAYMTAHYALFLFGSGKTKVFVTLLLVISSVIAIFGASEQSSKLFGIGLKAFGAGGQIDVLIYDETNLKPFEAKLLLITPTNLYFTKDDKSGFIPVSRLRKMIEK